MKNKIYELYFKYKYEIKAIAKALNKSPRYIRKILLCDFREKYSVEKASRSSQRLKKRKVKDREKKNKLYAKEKLKEETVKLKEKFDFLEVVRKENNISTFQSLSIEEIRTMREQRLDFGESQKKYISDYSFIMWNSSAYITNENGVKVFDSEKYGKYTKKTLPTSYDFRSW